MIHEFHNWIVRFIGWAGGYSFGIHQTFAVVGGVDKMDYLCSMWNIFWFPRSYNTQLWDDGFNPSSLSYLNMKKIMYYVFCFSNFTFQAKLREAVVAFKFRGTAEVCSFWCMHACEMHYLGLAANALRSWPIPLHVIINFEPFIFVGLPVVM